MRLLKLFIVIMWHVASPHSGIGNYVFNLFERLCDQGKDVDMLYYDAEGTMKFDHSRIKVLRQRFRWPFMGRTLLKAVCKVQKDISDLMLVRVGAADKANEALKRQIPTKQYQSVPEAQMPLFYNSMEAKLLGILVNEKNELRRPIVVPNLGYNGKQGNSLIG